VGLGNPGPTYASTRHNIGWLVLDRLAREAGSPPFKSKFQGELAKATLGGQECLFLLPQTFMNESGRSVQPAAAFFQVTPRDVIVVHDELDLPFADVRVKLGGGHAGHNGLRSIVQHLGTADFVRVRMGIGRPPTAFKGDVAAFVLSGFTAEERPRVPGMVETGAEAVLQILGQGLERAMKACNTKKEGN
jgi:PTH1 family peptidyl-tRNA hydrolase